MLRWDEDRTILPTAYKTVKLRMQEFQLVDRDATAGAIKCGFSHKGGRNRDVYYYIQLRAYHS